MAKLTQRLGFTRYEADEYYRQALEFFRKGAFDDAIDYATHAINTLPRNPEYYAARGFFYHEDGVLDKAQADFEQALRLHPFEFVAHYGLGMIAYKNKAWDTALTHFQNATYADRNRPESLYYLALVLHRRGDNPAALTTMQAAHEAFDAAGDRRRSNATKWLREFARLVEEQAEALAAPDNPRLPGFTESRRSIAE